MVSSLYLVIPGLLDRVGEWNADYGAVGRFPHLEWLLTRARVEHRPPRGIEAALADRFHLRGPVPAGALTRLALTGEHSPDSWMCMDPVHLEAGISDLVLTGPDELRLTRDEARGLVARINEYMARDGLVLEATTPARWHLRLPADQVPPQTEALSAVKGRAVNRHLPRGQDARLWHRRLNELQMILFEAPENLAREANGMPSVNSVWPWGAGRLPRQLTAPAEGIFGDGPLLAGLAQCARTVSQPLPETADPVLESAASVLVFMDRLTEDVAVDDIEAWQASMEGLEITWFGPLRRALGSPCLKHLVIDSTCGPVFSLGSGAHWRLWRRPRSLETFAP